jgi:Domain of unknown function DUF11/Thrombospondin type 3 repeat
VLNRAESAGGPIDWDGNPPPVLSGLKIDLNCFGGETLWAYREWDRLDFNFRDAAAGDPTARVIEEPPLVVARWGIDDADGDGVVNASDYCPTVPNPNPQADADQDGVGDACERGPTADIEIAIRPEPYVTPAPGARATLEVTVINSGPHQATALAIQLQRLATFTAMAGNPNAGTFDGATGRWEIGTLDVGVPVILTVSGTIATGGAVRAYVATLDQTDPDATMAGVYFGGGPGPGATWHRTDLNGTVANPPPFNVGDQSFWCPVDEDPIPDYGSNECLSRRPRYPRFPAIP